MKFIACLVGVVCCLNLISCKKAQSLAEKQKEIETGKLDDSLAYTAEEIGWSAQVPAGWEVMTKEKTQELQDKGKDLIEKSAEASLDTSALKQLLNLQKDPFNNLLSTIEPYDEAADGSWLENNKAIFDVVIKSFTDAKLKMGQTKTGVETIDGLEFQTWEIEILKPSGEGVLLTQKMYSRLINRYDFGVTVTTNNEKDRTELEKLVHGSKFTKRDNTPK